LIQIQIQQLNFLRIQICNHRQMTTFKDFGCLCNNALDISDLAQMRKLTCYQAIILAATGHGIQNLLETDGVSTGRVVAAGASLALRVLQPRHSEHIVPHAEQALRRVLGADGQVRHVGRVQDSPALPEELEAGQTGADVVVCLLAEGEEGREVGSHALGGGHLFQAGGQLGAAGWRKRNHQGHLSQGPTNSVAEYAEP
jgi:hypothetical protein